MAKWPDVPAVVGWLRLDGHGRWLLRDEPIAHAGLIAFIGRNYACDEQGRWFFQNGPQRVYVHLDYTPWVLYIDNAGRIRAHTGRAIERVERVILDDHGDLLLLTELGAGIAHPDALPVLADRFVDGTGEPASADAIDRAVVQPVHDAPADLHFRHGDDCIMVEHIARNEVPAEFGFMTGPAGEPDR